jgi:hypothetical protein
MPMTAITLLLTILLTAPAAAPGVERRAGAPHPGTLSLDPPSGGVRIPIDLRGNQIYLRGRINDSDSLWMALDSGASANAIDAGVARSLGLAASGYGRARDAGRGVGVATLRNAIIRLPGATLTGAPLAAVPMEAFGRQTGEAMDAIIGNPLMNHCVVRIDYLARTLELLPAESFEYRGSGVVLPLTFRQRLPYITARLTIPGREPVDGRFVIDLGSSQALILTPTFVRDERVLDAVPNTLQARGRGVGAQIPARAGRVARLEIGGIGFDNPVTMVPVSPMSQVSAPGTAGNIGGEILRRFTVTFDYSRSRMILEPNARIGDAFEWDMSGLGVRMGPEGSGMMQVDWIQSRSPADEAGMRADDLIEAIDGRPVLEVGIPALREMLRRDGESHRFGVRRGNEQIEITFTTRRMI